METELGQEKTVKLEKYLAIALIVLVTLITYAILVNAFGYYLDDWYILWAGRTSGTGLIIDYHQFDRPLMGYFYAFYYFVLGDHPLGWQVFALILRVASVLVFWAILRMLWPKSWVATTSAALIFAVYPGFLQMPQAGIKVNPLFTLTSALISIAFTVRVAQVKSLWKSIIFQALSLLFGAVYLFYIEYMVGLEFFRWGFLWIALNQRDDLASLKDRAKRWIFYAAPMFFVLAIMMGWRLFIFDSGRKSMNVGSITENFVVSPFHSIAGLIIEPARDFIETTFDAWVVPGYKLSAGASYRPWATSAVLAILVIILYCAYSIWVQKTSQNDQNGDGKTFIWLGLLGMAAALVPLVLVGRQVYMDLTFNGFNKYTLHASVGVSLLIIGFLLVSARRVGLIGIVAILLGLAVQTHYFNGLRYQEAWQYQKDLWWQLAWRAPDLEDGTLLTATLPSDYLFSENYEIWAPANMIYRPDSQEIKVTGEILTNQTIAWYQRGITDERLVRGVTPLSRDFRNALILSIPNSSSCLHVVDGGRLEDNSESQIVKLVFQKSHIDQIITKSSSVNMPPPEIFGLEPEHGWCYYYQKISLARQRRDWAEAASWADQAAALGLKPINRSELIPVIEAYAQLNRLEDARPLAAQIRKDADLIYLYCSQPQGYSFSSESDNQAVYALMCENE